MPRGEYLRWPTDAKIPILLTLQEINGEGSTGKFPQISIRRYRDKNGTALDGYYWDGVSGFQSSPNWITMTEKDSVELPGLYTYLFDQDLVAIERTYLVYFRHTIIPIGFATELHVVTNDVYAPVDIAEPVIIGNNVMSELARIKDGGTGNFSTTRDSLYHTNQTLLRILGLLHENSIVDNQQYDENNQLNSARLRVFDSVGNLPSSPGGNETTGLLFEYTITADFESLGILKEYKIARVQ